ncbi:hypothetical protein DSECCO2_213360 [anaerobic digester metagenome]
MTDKSLSWEEALQEFQKQREETKTVEFPVGAGTVRFKIRQLTQADKDRIEERALRARGRGGNISAVELARLKRDYIRAGVVEGPPGFTLTSECIDEFPVYVRDGLADAIEKWHTLDEDTEADFRLVGEG